MWILRYHPQISTFVRLTLSQSMVKNLKIMSMVSSRQLTMEIIDHLQNQFSKEEKAIRHFLPRNDRSRRTKDDDQVMGHILLQSSSRFRLLVH